MLLILGEPLAKTALMPGSRIARRTRLLFDRGASGREILTSLGRRPRRGTWRVVVAAASCQSPSNVAWVLTLSLPRTWRQLRNIRHAPGHC